MALQMTYQGLFSFHRTAVAASSTGTFALSGVTSTLDDVGSNYHSAQNGYYAGFMAQTTGAVEINPAGAFLADGRYVLTWQKVNTLGNYDIYFSIGNTWVGDQQPTQLLGPTLANSGASSGDQWAPKVVGLTNGNFAISWFDDNDGRYKARVFDHDGGALSGVLVLNPTTLATGDPVLLSMDLVAMPNGGFAAGYTAGGGKMSIFNSAFQAVATEVDLTASSGQPALERLANGLLVAVESSAAGLSGQFFNSAGAPTGSAFTIPVTGVDAGEWSVPEIAALSDGRFAMVTSASWPTTTSGSDVWLFVLKADGSLDSAPQKVVPVNAHLVTGAYDPHIEVLADGRIIVSYTTETASGKSGQSAFFEPRTSSVTLTGSAINDSYTGTAFDDYLAGGAGSDFLSGENGKDTILGGSGIDFLDGDDGNDLIYGGTEEDFMSGGNGNDLLFGGLGGDSLAGGDGLDYTRYDDANYGDIRVSLAANQTLGTGAAAGDTFYEIEGVISGAGNDWIYGDNNANWLYGGSGNDNIMGSNGADYINGGAGLDYARFDDANYAGLTADLANTITKTGAAAGDTYVNVEGLILTRNADFGYGDGNGNYLYGLGGGDTLDGRGGADFLNGGIGNDTLTGGTGNDVYTMRIGYGRDTILDFAGGTGVVDRLDLKGCGFANFAAVLAASVQVGANLEVRVNAADVFVLNGFSKGNFAADDVILV